MNPLIGVIDWVFPDLASGCETPGHLELTLDCVEIIPIEVRRRDKVRNERLRHLTPADPEFMQKMTEIVQQLETETDPSLNEVVEVMYKKTFLLPNDTSISLGEDPKEEPRGFGLCADRTDIDTFSWEWFNVKSTGQAEKLHETGTISFETAKTPCGVEITHMIFETDVSLRIKRSDAGVGAKPEWRINVLQGSEIYWPSLVDGTVTPNGFIAR